MFPVEIQREEVIIAGIDPIEGDRSAGAASHFISIRIPIKSGTEVARPGKAQRIEHRRLFRFDLSCNRRLAVCGRAAAVDGERDLIRLDFQRCRISRKRNKAAVVAFQRLTVRRIGKVGVELEQSFSTDNRAARARLNRCMRSIISDHADCGDGGAVGRALDRQRTVGIVHTGGIKAQNAAAGQGNAVCGRNDRVRVLGVCDLCFARKADRPAVVACEIEPRIRMFHVVIVGCIGFAIRIVMEDPAGVFHGIRFAVDDERPIRQPHGRQIKAGGIGRDNAGVTCRDGVCVGSVVRDRVISAPIGELLTVDRGRGRELDGLAGRHIKDLRVHLCSCAGGVGERQRDRALGRILGVEADNAGIRARDGLAADSVGRAGAVARGIPAGNYSVEAGKSFGLCAITIKNILSGGVHFTVVVCVHDLAGEVEDNAVIAPCAVGVEGAGSGQGLLRTVRVDLEIGLAVRVPAEEGIRLAVSDRVFQLRERPVVHAAVDHSFLVFHIDVNEGDLVLARCPDYSQGLCIVAGFNIVLSVIFRAAVGRSEIVVDIGIIFVEEVVQHEDSVFLDLDGHFVCAADGCAVAALDGEGAVFGGIRPVRSRDGEEEGQEHQECQIQGEDAFEC